MQCKKCKQHFVVDICENCGEPYINDKTQKYLDELKKKQSFLESKCYYKAGKKRKKSIKSQCLNHTLEPYLQ